MDVLVSHSQTFNKSPDRLAFQTTPILLVVLSRFWTHRWIVWFSAPWGQNGTVGIMSHVTSDAFVFPHNSVMLHQCQYFQ